MAWYLHRGGMFGINLKVLVAMVTELCTHIMVIRCRFRSQSPTVLRLSSYFGPEICECRQRQISQPDQGRLWVTRESSFHLPDQQLCETILRDVIISSSPHLYSFHAGWGTFRKWTEVGHVAFHHFFLAFSIPRNETTATFHSSLTVLYDVSPSTTAHLIGLRAVCGIPRTIGRGPVAIPGWRYGFAHSRAFINWRSHSSYNADLVLARRRKSLILWP